MIRQGHRDRFFWTAPILVLFVFLCALSPALSRPLPPDLFCVDLNPLPIEDGGDPALLQAMRDLEVGRVRLPGGGTAPYWDWERGGLVRRSGVVPPFGDQARARRGLTLAALEPLFDRLAALPLFVANPLTLSVDNNLGQLRQAQRLGLAVDRLQLGESPSPRLDWQQQAALLARQQALASAVRAAFPVAQLALPLPAPDGEGLWPRWMAGWVSLAAQNGLFAQVEALALPLRLHRPALPEGWPAPGTLPPERARALAGDMAGLLLARSRASLAALDTLAVPRNPALWITSLAVDEPPEQPLLAGTWLQGLVALSQHLLLLGQERVRHVCHHVLTGHPHWQLLVGPRGRAMAPQMPSASPASPASLPNAAEGVAGDTPGPAPETETETETGTETDATARSEAQETAPNSPAPSALYRTDAAPYAATASGRLLPLLRVLTGSGAQGWPARLVPLTPDAARHQPTALAWISHHGEGITLLAVNGGSTAQVLPLAGLDPLAIGVEAAAETTTETRDPSLPGQAGLEQAGLERLGPQRAGPGRWLHRLWVHRLWAEPWQRVPGPQPIHSASQALDPGLDRLEIAPFSVALITATATPPWSPREDRPTAPPAAANRSAPIGDKASRTAPTTATATAAAGAISRHKGLVYAEPEGRPLHLDLYLPPRPWLNPKVPVVLYLHGGGWRRGGREQLPSYLNRLVTEDRYALASAEYRLSGEAVFPAALHDAKAAVRWLRAEGRRWGLDGTRIVAWGQSAGGHLAALLATTDDEAGLNGSLGTHVGIPNHIRAAVALFAPTDLASLAADCAVSDCNHDPAAAASPGSRLLGCPLSDCLDLARTASPVFHVDATSAPILLAHGDRDRLVPYRQARRLWERMRSFDRPTLLVTVEGGGHGSFPEPAVARLRRVLRELLEKG